MKAYSMDLRERVFADCDAGMEVRQVAVKYRVSESWIRLLKLRRRENGEVAPHKSGHAAESKWFGASRAAGGVGPCATRHRHQRADVVPRVASLAVDLQKVLCASEQDRPDVHKRQIAWQAEMIHNWHKSLLHDAVPPLIAQWEDKLGVKVTGDFLQRMKTKWGGCNHRAGHIRLNTELAKKPTDLLEYVIVHEMIHLLEPTHSERFIAILEKHYPTWREARVELNELLLTVEVWKC